MSRLKLTRRAALLGAGAGIAAISASRWHLRNAAAQPTLQPLDKEIFARSRRDAFTILPPDGDRSIDIFVPNGKKLNSRRVRNGNTVAFETGGVWQSAPEFKRLKGVRFTAYGDRQKPWPLFRGSKKSFKLIKSRDCTVEFLEAANFVADCWHVFDSKNITFNWVIGRDSGNIRGDRPDSGNRGHAFELRGSKLTAVAIRNCEGFGMAEDGLQAGPDVKRGRIDVTGCYFHDNVEDGIDIKAGDFTVASTTLENNGSKALVLHGNAGQVQARDTRFAGSKLHDGVYIDGRNGDLRKLRAPIVFERCDFVGNTGWGLIAKRTIADVVLKDTFFAKNIAGDWESGTGHEGQIRIV